MSIPVASFGALADIHVVKGGRDMSLVIELVDTVEVVPT
jgi:hypothetical protein